MNNRSIKEFLENLTDIELAKLYKTKFKSYLKESQELVLEEIRKRDLTELNLEVLSRRKNNKTKQKVYCSDCNSTKLDILERTARQALDEIVSDRVEHDDLLLKELVCTCLACGKINVFWVKEPSFWNRITGHWSQRIIRKNKRALTR
ncbi:hypothetical protein [Carboxylicivirga sp. RSCT41]|uniref:hypothetical protein n=1 Tax=Carboxylicivirga agarovorans TaxID=3417570 RepID=UPI003D33501B